ncbi:hypothetical protein ACFVH7_12480 [Kitasatospora indigofera]|uniref:hypothetical protein n=1 Tax=Kitasatospora indigofera TaxID=67307 RepID=UPI00362D659C
MSDYVTISHDPSRSTLLASAPDRPSAQQLERAGFVREDATGFYRLRKDTTYSTALRMVRDAARLLHNSEYGLLRLYSEDEQRSAAPAATASPGPVRTSGPGTIWSHHVNADVAEGHLVLLARFSGANTEVELLGTYPATGEAATFYTEADSRHFGVIRHPDLDSALAEFGRPLSMPAPAISRAAAARAASRDSAQIRTGGPAPSAAPPPGAPTAAATHAQRPF